MKELQSMGQESALEYVKLKDDYHVLQEKFRLLQADYDQLKRKKEELQQKGIVLMFSFDDVICNQCSGKLKQQTKQY